MTIDLKKQKTMIQISYIILSFSETNVFCVSLNDYKWTVENLKLGIILDSKIVNNRV